SQAALPAIPTTPQSPGTKKKKKKEKKKERKTKEPKETKETKQRKGNETTKPTPNNSDGSARRESARLESDLTLSPSSPYLNTPTKTGVMNGKSSTLSRTSVQMQVTQGLEMFRAKYKVTRRE